MANQMTNRIQPTAITAPRQRLMAELLSFTAADLPVLLGCDERLTIAAVGQVRLPVWFAGRAVFVQDAGG